MKCIVCRAPTPDARMCGACDRAWDRWSKSSADDGSQWAIIEWVAKRAWRAARKARCKK